MYDKISPQMARTLGSMSIRYQSDTFVSDWYLIDIESRFFTIVTYQPFKFECEDCPKEYNDPEYFCHHKGQPEDLRFCSRHQAFGSTLKHNGKPRPINSLATERCSYNLKCVAFQHISSQFSVKCNQVNATGLGVGLIPLGNNLGLGEALYVCGYRSR